MLFTTCKLDIHKEDSLGENIRLISDILHYTADQNLEGIALFMHFQKKTSGSIEWDYLLRWPDTTYIYTSVTFFESRVLARVSWAETEKKAGCIEPLKEIKYRDYPKGNSAKRTDAVQPEWHLVLLFVVYAVETTAFPQLDVNGSW